ncbi:MAG: C4-dicarboxylate ABC transporter permease [Betaproteobacteria bacterium RIFCSPLOWO2_12_FULL_62_13]|nr:MAG: C4-dicarboxylate ABC transporter permease [Betaproteobacteria bacterium RIFCSPLOWO2_12_FULL_62_13]
MLVRVRSAYETLLEAIAIVLMVTLACEVVIGVIFRSIGESLVWYDEIASILLAWITYYGAALAAMRGAHIGVPGLVEAMPRALRLATTLFAEACVIGFFALMAWIGWSVLDVLATDHLVSLPEVSVKYTQSVIPIGATLFMIAELLRLPQLLRAAAGAGAPRMGINP